MRNDRMVVNIELRIVWDVEAVCHHLFGGTEESYQNALQIAGLWPVN
jgi:hypothetical protein